MRNSSKDRVEFHLEADSDPESNTSASPDGRHLVYTRYEEPATLMMIENFR